MAAVVEADSPEKTAPDRGLALTAIWETGPAVGVGVDICPWTRLREAPVRWRGRAERVFSEGELTDFHESLAIPWAAREAILKALGLASILGAPLAEMTLERGSDLTDLHYAPTGVARQQLEARGLNITLRAWLLEEAAIVVALSEDASSPGQGICSLRAERVEGDQSCQARLAAERAAETAARTAGTVVQTGVWSGGGGRAPMWSGLPEARVSLSHDQGLVAGAILLEDTSP